MFRRQEFVIFSNLRFNKKGKFHAQLLSWAWKTYYNLRLRDDRIKQNMILVSYLGR